MKEVMCLVFEVLALAYFMSAISKCRVVIHSKDKGMKLELLARVMTGCLFTLLFVNSKGIFKESMIFEVILLVVSFIAAILNGMAMYNLSK